MIDKTEEKILKDIAYYKQKGDRWEEARSVGLLGAKYREERKLQKAVETWLEAARIWQSLGNYDGAASTLFGVADIYWYRPHHPIPGLGDIHRAIAYAEQAVALASRKELKAYYLLKLSFMYALSGNLQRAIQCLDQAGLYDKEYLKDRATHMKTLEEFSERGYMNW